MIRKYSHKHLTKLYWTPGAIMCYKLNGICSGCEYENYFHDKDHKCQMYQAVQRLLKTLGEPPTRKNISF